MAVVLITLRIGISPRAKARKCGKIKETKWAEETAQQPIIGCQAKFRQPQVK
jgi:hypothetical protein